MTNLFAENNETAIPAYVVSSDDFDKFRKTLDKNTNTWIQANSFCGKFGQALMCPNVDGGFQCALIGIGSNEDRLRSRFCLAAAAQKLPCETFFIANEFDLPEKDYELLGWLMNSYQFKKYKSQSDESANLIAPAWANKTKLEALAKAETLCCNLINTPANDMSPLDLEHASRTLASEFGAKFEVHIGDELLNQNFPLIHAVGKASSTPPRLIKLQYGARGPKLALVGKGVCFDTGGLNLKASGSIGLMKKDMAGAANILALARIIMELKYPCQLQVIIPTAENAISENAFRPQDVLVSRNGLSIEVNNTDAEGRLLLADALAYASESDPNLIISMATLTGAARVAVGPDISPFYVGSEKYSTPLMQASRIAKDPLWPMPFWDPYEDAIEPSIADLDNAPKSGFAGSITAALFLRRFVSEPANFIHFDIYGWNSSRKAGRPAGGALQGPRAIFEALDNLF